MACKKQVPKLPIKAPQTTQVSEQEENPCGLEADCERVITADELRKSYFFGIRIIDQQGNEMEDDTINFYIDGAQEELEQELNLKFIRDRIVDKRDFRIDDYRNWGFIKMNYPIHIPIRLEGFVNDVRQITYPIEWVTTGGSSAQRGKSIYSRNVSLVPTTNSSRSGSVVYSGITPHLGFFGNRQIPNYWEFEYCTGWLCKEIPKDIKNAVGKMAAIAIFHNLGDLILGAGIANFSLGLDGFSQSIGTTSSATSAGYGSRILGYQKDLELALPRLKAYYSDINFTVC